MTAALGLLLRDVFSRWSAMDRSIDRPSPAIRQAGVVPFRITQGAMEFCLVTGRKSGRWQFPKGWIESPHGPEETALLEAWEEAGLRGDLIGEPVGVYRLAKRSRSFSVVLYAMQVAEAAETWQEREERQRLWCDLEEARQLLGRPLRAILKLVAERHAKSVGDIQASTNSGE